MYPAIGLVAIRQAWNGFTKRYVVGGEPVARDRDYVRAIANAQQHAARGALGSCW